MPLFSNAVYKEYGVKPSSTSSTSSVSEDKGLSTILTSPLKNPIPSKASIAKFDKDFLPDLEKHGYDKVYDHEQRKMVENAYNGSYASVKKKMYADGNKEVGDALSSLEIVAQKMKVELSKDVADPNEIKRLIHNSNIYGERVEKAFSKKKDLAYKYDVASGKLLESKDYWKENQNPISMSGTSTNAYVEKSNGFMSTLGMLTGNPILESNKNVSLKNEEVGNKWLMDVDSRFKDDIKRKRESHVQRWYDKALSNINPDDNSKVDFNKTALQMSTDILNHTFKYGTSGDKEQITQDKKVAELILRNLQGKSVKEQMAFIKMDSTKEKLKDISNRLGYYGNEMLFKKHRSLADNSDFEYNQNEIVKHKKEIEGINKTVAIYDGFRKDASSIKTMAIEKLPGLKEQNKYLKEINPDVFNQALVSAFDDRGNIVSLDKFKNRLVDYMKTQPTTQKGKYEHHYFINALIPEVTTFGIFLPPDIKTIDKKAEEVYYNITKGYKQVVDDSKVKYKYKNTLVTLGLGNEKHEAIGYESVNISVNEFGELKSSSSPKQENVAQIWNVLRSNDGTFGEVSKAYILPMNTKEDRGTVNLLESKELNNFAESSNGVMNNFIKSVKDPSDISLTFKKYSNVPGYAMYEFKDKATGKSVAALINNNQLGSRGVKENLYMNSYDNVEEEAFKIKGFKELGTRKGDNSKDVIRNPVIRWDGKWGSFVLDAQVPDSQKPGDYTKLQKGNGEPITFPGLSLSEATRSATYIIDGIIKEL